MEDKTGGVFIEEFVGFKLKMYFWWMITVSMKKQMVQIKLMLQ